VVPVIPVMAGVSPLPVDEDEVFRVPVGVAVVEWLGVGDDDWGGFVLGLTEPLGVALAGGVWLAQSPDGVAVTVCSTAALCVGLGFVEVLVGFGVGVVLPLSLGPGDALELSLAPGLLLPLAVLVGVAVLGAALLDRTAVLLFVAAFDGVDEADGDGEHDEIAPGDLPPADWLAGNAPPLPSAAPPPVLVGVDAGVDELRPAVWRNWWRSGGTVASTMPTANTAKPTARAGRSIASRQSRGR
jgi:hypothetical protein